MGQLLVSKLGRVMLSVDSLQSMFLETTNKARTDKVDLKPTSRSKNRPRRKYC